MPEDKNIVKEELNEELSAQANKLIDALDNAVINTIHDNERINALALIVAISNFVAHGSRFLDNKFPKKESWLENILINIRHAAREMNEQENDPSSN